MIKNNKFIGSTLDSLLEKDDPIIKLRKEIYGNKRFIEDSIENDGEIVFVNGELYRGEVIFGRYKGFGWESGRTYSIELDNCVDKNSEVYLIDCCFGKIRRCVFIQLGNILSYITFFCSRNCKFRPIQKKYSVL